MGESYPQGEALLAACRSGRGVIVIVEGERYDEDAWFYDRWFATRGREITFVPQNGWESVVAAVARLRAELPHRRIYGLIDRDFAPASLLAGPSAALPEDGILRPERYTLENYLLDPAGWLATLRSATRGALPAGWQDEAELTAQITAAYRDCIAVAAWNLTIRREYDRHPTGAAPEYKEHPDALTKAKEPPAQTLRTWGEGRAAPQSLDQAYEDHQAMLHGLPVSDWPQWITGKAVLKVFLQRLPGKKLPQELLLSWYLDKHPDPPADLLTLIQRILSAP